MSDYTQFQDDEDRAYSRSVSDGDNDRGFRFEQRSVEDIIETVRGRYSVTDLIEQSDEDLARGDELFYAAKTQIGIVEQGETGMIRWWRVASGDNEYDVRRFKNFVWCSCKDFFFKKKMCKHLAFTTGVYCQNCRVLAAKVDKLCHDCDVNRKAVGGRQ